MFPVDPVGLVVFDQLLESLSGNELGRGALARAVRVFSILCRESAAALATRRCFPYVLAFVLNYYEIGPARRFCDRLPTGFVMAGPPAPPQPAILVTAALAQRAACAAHAEDGPPFDDDPFNDSLPPNLPLAVRAFVRFVRRQHAEFMAHAHCKYHFCACARSGCDRTASRHAPEDLSLIHISEPTRPY